MMTRPLLRGEAGRGLIYILGVLFIGAFIGSVLGEVSGTFLPEGFLRDLTSKGVVLGLNPPYALDLKVLSFTLGLTIRLNLTSILGFLIAAFLLKRLT